jgi:hypothetical protein
MHLYTGKKSPRAYWSVHVPGIAVSPPVKVFLEAVEDVLDAPENIKVEAVIELQFVSDLGV